MPLPSFFVIGAPKCGTTALYRALRKHPEVYMARLKEPHYFSYHREESASDQLPGARERLRVTEPLAYFNLFSGVRGERVVGEASTSYLASRVAARRIKQQLPEAKLVALLRHPVERVHSSYWYYLSIGRERAPSLEAALDPAGAEADRRMRHQHLKHGFYHEHLSVWYARFPREQIRVYVHEELLASPQSVLKDLFEFLGVDPTADLSMPVANPTRAPRSRRLHGLANGLGLAPAVWADARFNRIPPPPMRGDTWRSLLAEYRHDIEQLQTLIGRDLSHWLKPPAESDLHQPTAEVAGAGA